MTEHHDDDNLQPNSDGELSEDALFEWDGEEWVNVEHEPFLGVVPVLEAPANVNAGVPLSRMVMFIAGVILCVIFGLFGWRVVTVQNQKQAQIIAYRETTEAMVPARCHDLLFSPAYIFISRNYVLALSTQFEYATCWLFEPQIPVSSPQLSADGRRLYYISDDSFRRVYVRNIATGETTYISDVSEDPVDGFDLSPDGLFIAYTQGGSLYVRDLFRNTVTTVPNLPEGLPVSFPTWSPDGSEIAVAVGGCIGRVRLDGSDYVGSCASDSQYKFYEMLAWSPDGAYIAAISKDERNRDISHLVVLRIDDNTFQRITPSDDETYVGFPQWYSDSTHIALMIQYRSYLSPSIAIYDLEGHFIDRISQPSPFSFELSGFDLWYGSE